jgi:ABC-type phosphate transport system substrate-binding protein
LFGRAREIHRRLVLRGAGTLLVLCAALGAVSPVLAGDAPSEFRVITHASRREASVTREFLADAFLKNVAHWPDDEAIRPVDQRADSTVRRHFSDGVLRRSVQAVKTYWQQRIFSGRGVPPPEVDSDDAVVRYVEAHPGALGYISGNVSPGKAKVLAVAP